MNTQEVRWLSLKSNQLISQITEHSAVWWFWLHALVSLTTDITEMMNGREVAGDSPTTPCWAFGCHFRFVLPSCKQNILYMPLKSLITGVYASCPAGVLCFYFIFFLFECNRSIHGPSLSWPSSKHPEEWNGRQHPHDKKENVCLSDI